MVIPSGLVVSGGSIENNSGSITNNGTVTLTGNVVNNDTIAGNGAYEVGGNWTNSGTFTAGSSTLNLNGTGAQSINAGGSTFNNLTITNTGGTCTASSAITVSTLDNGGAGNVAAILDMAGNTLTATTVENTGATIKFSGSSNGLAIGTGTVEYFGSAQNIYTGIYQNLIFSGAGVKTLGSAITINGNLSITGAGTTSADLGTFTSTAASLSLGGVAQATETSHGSSSSPAVVTNDTYFAPYTGIINVGSCISYNLSSTVTASPICAGSSATINVTANAANLPVGSYAVVYSLSAPNAASGSASMTVTAAGQGSFTTPTLPSSGTTTITITRLTKGCSSSISTNNAASITVNSLPAISIQPSSPATVCAGSGTPTFTVTATGSGLTYQWEEFISSWKPISNGGVYSNVTSSSLTITNPPSGMNGYKYRCVVSGTCVPAATSDGLATLSVNPQSIGGTVSGGTSICSGSTSALLTLSGYTGTILKWQSSVSPFSTWSDIVNATANYTSGALTETTQFRAVVQSGVCSGATSASTTVTVYPVPTTAAAGPDQSLSCEITTAMLSGNTAIVGSGNWSIISGTGGNLSNPSSPASQFIGLNGISYVLRWTISNGTCVSSDDVNINFYSLPFAPAAASSQSLCSSGTVSDIQATAPSGGTVLWYTAATGGSSLPANQALASMAYYGESRGATGCTSLTRTKVTVNVNASPTVVITTPAAVCSGSTVDLTSASLTNGSTSGLTFSYWTDAGATSALAAPSAVATSGTYYIKGTTSSGCFTIQPVTVTITPLPVATISYSGSPLCSSSGPVSVSRTGTTGGTYSASPGGLTIDAGTGTITPGTSTAGTYTITYTMAATGGCSVQTATSTVTVTTLPVAIFSYTGTPYCKNSANPSPAFSGGGVAGTFSSTAGLVFVSTATGQVNLAASTAGTYTVTNTIAAAGGCGVVTATSSITITTLPTANISYGGNPFCKTTGSAQSVTFTGTSGGTYSASPAGLTLNGSNGDITPFSSTAGTYTVTYTIAAAGGCGLVTASSGITITALPVATIAYSGTPFCSNIGTGTISLTGTTGGVYSSAAGLSLNATSGDITTATSTPGTYTVTYTIAAAGGCAIVTATTQAAIKLDGSWIGGGSDWNTGANWDCGIVPSSSTDVIIANGKTPYPILSSGSSGQTKNLTIDAGTSLTVSGKTLQISGAITKDATGTFTATAGTIEMTGISAQLIPASTFATNTIMNLTINNSAGVTLQGPLNVTGIVTPALGNLNSAGNLTLLSTASQTALISGTGIGTVTGNVTMQRYLPSAFGYKYFSSPFSDATVSQFSGYLSTTPGIAKFYRYEENNLSSGSPISGWTNYATGSNPLAAMKGYAANLGSSATPRTISITGSVNNGAVLSTLYNNNQTYTKGFNLVGNPYPSPIDWNAGSGWTKTNIDNALYFFNASGATDEYSGTYNTYINGTGTGGSTNIIPSMQGFFVHVSNGGYPVTGTLGMTNSVRTNDLNPTFKAAPIDTRTVLRFALNFDGNKSLSDNFVVYFDPLSTLNFDSDRDALKLMNTDSSVPNLYSLTPDIRQLSINGIPSPDDSPTSIPLGVQILKDGWVNFTAKDISRLPTEMNIYLLDKEKNITQDLNTNPSYRFFLKAGENNQRLVLLFSKSAAQVLPTDTNHSEKLFAISKIAGNVMVKINLPDYQPGKLYLYNMLGQIILEKEVTHLQTVDISSIVKSGVYVVTITSGVRTQSEKTLIQK